ncbi:protein CTR9 homolog isoform X2 [Actinidia eriantha]|uniref:protein CTR9 homolog isoform X2 n=1 Tax=Actinidia eriantha TaxID=165200 RepID=UPI00258385D5|nr:protein CTR9 homolog isoform X2 [Actinidia eriantha]
MLYAECTSTFILKKRSRTQQLAEQTFMEALDDGIWRTLIDGNAQPYAIDASLSIHQYKDMQVFHPLEEDGFTVEVPWNKISIPCNLARLFEQSHNIEKASILHRLILFKYSDYVDSYLTLAGIAKARNNVQMRIELWMTSALMYY